MESGITVQFLDDIEVALDRQLGRAWDRLGDLHWRRDDGSGDLRYLGTDGWGVMIFSLDYGMGTARIRVPPTHPAKQIADIVMDNVRKRMTEDKEGDMGRCNRLHEFRGEVTSDAEGDALTDVHTILRIELKDLGFKPKYRVPMGGFPREWLDPTGGDMEVYTLWEPARGGFDVVVVVDGLEPSHPFIGEIQVGHKDDPEDPYEAVFTINPGWEDDIYRIVRSIKAKGIGEGKETKWSRLATLTEGMLEASKR